ncbi:MAG TPA: TadE/TadG family type IV pilus assembly protein [Dehalococcoidia bacterium]|nr:TadE/TadG family type IV pilus assembly protein [Dehalococcoidia bacterium]
MATKITQTGPTSRRTHLRKAFPAVKPVFVSGAASNCAAPDAERLKPATSACLRRERGQALIEMALILPLIVVFILTLVDFGIAIDRREVLQHAVYEGSRRAIVGTTVDEIKARTIAQSQGLLTAADITVCYVDSDGNGDINAGDDARVSASYDYNFSVGGGEILTAFGVPVPSISLTPSADSRLANGPQDSEPEC